MRELVSGLLADRAHGIEFHGFLSNHSKHAVIALAGLGASDARIKQYFSSYSACTPYGFPLEAAPADANSVVLAPKTWSSLIGKKTHFPALRTFFAVELERLGGRDALMREYGADLLPYMPGALTHGIIHLGWAMDAGSDHMVIEGAAYLAFCGVSVRPERFTPRAHADASPFASLLRLADGWHSSGGPEWAAAVKASPDFGEGFHPELKPAGFQHDVAKVLSRGHPLMYELPAWCEDTQDGALDQLYRAVVLLYLASAGSRAGQGVGRAPGKAGAGPGSFTGLHLLTSLWGVEHASRPLDVEARRQALRCYWATLVAISCTTAAGPPTRAILESTAQKFPAHAVESRADSARWDEVVRAGIAEEEEHNQKLCYLARRLRERDAETLAQQPGAGAGDQPQAVRAAPWLGWLAAANTFTFTPNVGPGRARAPTQPADG
mmetsp:Transcript_26397/g.71322  ORF Transcript_26397/g.71322 Transcript_26397/m.71322 type:complete len:437 (-) Transcript_26397:96-1406(-)